MSAVGSSSDLGSEADSDSQPVAAALQEERPGSRDAKCCGTIAAVNWPSAQPGHLLGLDGWSGADISALLDAAEALQPAARGESPGPRDLSGRIIANVFLEDSTRTRGSFTVAAQRLGGQVLDITGKGSSISKGESLLDTVWTIESFGVDAMVLRVSAAGGPALVARNVNVPVINAGDGRHEHPTQGLLDLLTLRQRLGSLDGKRVAIVGDIAGSRVARSAIHGLTALGANVVLIGPPVLVPQSMKQITGQAARGSITVAHQLDEHLEQLDAIMMLRVQFERGSSITGDYRALFGLTEARAARLPEHAIVMHPGPMNRGLEIDSAVADDPRRSVIRDQVTNGVAVRMAVLRLLLES